ncbi:MAG: bifunctional precorrin-2 dehydrogenase/sirohydrochlorin ferrochelatase [Gemmatimonadaceae bacterium]
MRAAHSSDAAPTFPVLLAGGHVRALVVGGGAVATRKALALLDAGATVRLVAPRIAPTLREAARERPARLTLVERSYSAGDVAEANLVIAATSDREVNAAVAREADALGRLVAVADAPEQGSWTAMAAHRAGALTIAVSAGGVPGAAARIRDALAERFDERYGDAVGRLAALRARLLAAGDGDEWRQLGGELLGPRFCADVETGELSRRLGPRDGEESWR